MVIRRWCMLPLFFPLCLTSWQLDPTTGTVAQSKWQNEVNKTPSFGQSAKTKSLREPENTGENRERGKLGKGTYKMVYVLGDINGSVSVMLRMELV